MKKYVVILGDGMPDYIVPQLDNRTPLEAAHTPHMDSLAVRGLMGMVKTVPPGYPPGSDVANLSVMGYDPARYYTGRSPLEAVSMGIDLKEEEVAFRCNLITLSQAPSFDKKIMLDYSAGEISTYDAARLIEEADRELGSSDFRFYPGVSYRHLMVWRGGPQDIDLTPPHDISDREIGPYLPGGEKGRAVREIMEKSSVILSRHPLNLDRIEKGLAPANCLWLWGQGKKPRLKSFMEKYGLKGSVISAVDLIKGIGLCAGLEVVDVPGATGNIHTDFSGKAKAALKELEKGKDFIYLHVEAPDEAGHQGKMEEKIKAIEEIDEKVVGEILKGLEKYEEYRLMVLSDHPTPLKIKTHVADPVPFVIYEGKGPSGKRVSKFCEEEARKTGIFLESGPRLMDYFLGKDSCN